MLKHSLIALLLSVSMPAFAQTETTPADAPDLSSMYLRAANNHASPLARLALAGMGALQRQQTPGAQSAPQEQWLAIRDSALADGADDAMVQALALQLDRRPASPEALAQHAAATAVLRRAVADNGFFGIVLLWQPEISADADLSRRLLHQAALAKTYRSTYGPVLRAVYPTFAGLAWGDVATRAHLESQDDADSARIVSQAIAAGLAVPSYGGLNTLCKEDLPQTRDDCRVLAERMLSEGDTVVDAVTGSTLLARLAVTDAEKKRAATARRQIFWQMEQHRNLPGVEEADQQREHFVATLASGERVAIRDALVRGKRSLDPPADWRAPDESASAADAAH